MKKILILGGTMFVGRSLAEKFIESGKYDITLFNRGKTNVELFKQVKQIHGDRETAEIEKVYGQQWDCIIDFSGYYPNTFEAFLKGIRGNVSRYIFISTISVYNLPKYEGELITERADMLPCTVEQRASKLPDAYGEKKAEMERILQAETDMDKIIFRPSYIYGKYDWTERFYYWLYRVQRESKFLLPDGGQAASISLSNADDLVEGLLQAVEIKEHSTVYNSVSTPSISIRELITKAAKTYDKKPEVITTDSAGLEKMSLKLSQFPLLSPLGFSVDSSLWERDFPFKRTDLVSSLLEMRDYKLAVGLPKPPVGLDADKETELIANGAMAI